MSTNDTAIVKQLGRIRISGILKTLTGLHIGGTSVGLAIGGADSTVVRNGLDGRPYIPGSSLKGKLRSLLDRVYTPGKLDRVGNSKVYKCASLADYQDLKKGFVFHLFGVTPEEIDRLGGVAMPTRLIVRDASMTDKTAEALDRSLYTDMPMTQVKTEVVIDRITSAATPRQIERVPAGACFEFEIIMNVFQSTDLEWLPYLSEAMELLEHDYIGGQGSRGYGQVRFVVRKAEAASFNGFNVDGDPRYSAWVQSITREEVSE
jgi:CRISPR-associated protein Csm3